MIEFLFELVFSFVFEVIFAAVAGGAEYALFKTRKRFWMWVVGVLCIAGMGWWRGPRNWTTWLLAGGWVAMLAYLDRRLMRPTPADGGA
jgi:hypothetical protein